ncbi:hypothetical protein [Corynebacterium nuruki]|uniref:hypothetical protein n=1 Tax=Corynebacterium nuruki TaxID=1032851 RepID=UPI0039BF1552
MSEPTQNGSARGTGAPGGGQGSSTADGGILGRIETTVRAQDPKILVAGAVAVGLVLMLLFGGIAGAIGANSARNDAVPADSVGQGMELRGDDEITYGDFIDGRDEVENNRRESAGGLGEALFGGALDSAYEQNRAAVLSAIDKAEDHVNSARTTWRIVGGLLGLVVAGGAAAGGYFWLRRRPAVSATPVVSPMSTGPRNDIPGQRWSKGLD